MRVEVLSVGKPRDKLNDELFRKHAERLGHHVELLVSHVAAERGDSRGAEAVRQAEAQRLRDALSKRSGLVIALDERGRSFKTRELARTLESDMERGVRHLSFVIGGAEGLDRDFVASADRVLSLSPLTFPHELARVVLAEQLYRCWSILAGHPYHRD